MKQLHFGDSTFDSNWRGPNLNEPNSKPFVPERSDTFDYETMRINENVFKPVREFPSGATRSSNAGKFDYEGFIDPGVLFLYGRYMHKHRKQADGKLRASDNWQKGLGKDACMESGMRHMMDAWMIHRSYDVYREQRPNGEETHIILDKARLIPEHWEKVRLVDSLCGIVFNCFAYLKELILNAGGAYGNYRT